MKHIVVDWMGNTMYGGKTFESFEDARGYIDEMSMHELEAERDGYCEDMYAVPVGGSSE